MKKYILALVCIVLCVNIYSQNVAITDDNSYTPNAKAMLDVKSTTKGMLIPRLTTVQRNAITSPVAGLLVYDSDLNNFYYYNGTAWINLSAGNANNIWSITNSKVFVTDTTYNMGIGTKNPNYKLVVQADGKVGSSDTLFVVNNKQGKPVFLVMQDGVKVIVDEAAKSNLGGFAVSGRTTGKGFNDYMLIRPDSIRMYVKENNAKANLGGFAVSGRTTGKSTIQELLRVTSDSTRIFTADTVKGFGVQNIGAAGNSSYMQLTPKNYFIGHEAGKSITNGKYNIFLGYQSGKMNKGGSFNTFIGYLAGSKNDQSDNTFIGFNAGMNHVLGGGNVFMGSRAGQFDSAGVQNIYIGELAGSNNKNGQYNVFIGHQSGYYNKDGIKNCFLGYMSGNSNISGDYNVFIGNSSGLSNTNGVNNVFIGNESGKKNTIGDKNCFLGYQSGLNNIGGYSNVFIGNSSGLTNSGGYSNSFLGIESGYNNTSGYENTFVGAYCGRANTTGSQNSFLGYQSGKSNTTGVNNTFLGSNTGAANTTGYKNSFIGYYSGSANVNGNFNTFIGQSSGYANVDGSYNTFVGNAAGKSSTSADFNSFFGDICGTNNSTGEYNSFFGSACGEHFASGNYNSLYGSHAGNSLTTSTANCFFGASAGSNTTTGSYNVFIGNQSGQEVIDGASNVYIGRMAGMNNASGASNVCIGNSSNSAATAGDDNVIIGVASAAANTTGSKNVYLGRIAAQNSTGSNNVVIGYGAMGFVANSYTNIISIGYNANATASNQVRIGNSSITTMYCKGAYNGDTVARPNMFVNSDGQIMRSTSTFTSSTGAANKIAYWSDASTLSSNTNLHWDNTNSMLGIGATAPKFPLDIVIPSTSWTGLRIRNNSTASGKNSLIYFTVTTNNYDDSTFSCYMGSQRTAVGHDLIFGTPASTSGSAVERMRILGDGSVGIGTNLPTALLHLKTSDYVKTIFEKNGVTAKGYLGNDGADFSMSTNAYYNGSAWVEDVTTSPSFIFLQHITNSQYEFRIKPASGSFSTAMVIETTGKVGIGSTAPSELLDVNGNGRFRAVASGAYSNSLSLTSNGTLTTSTSDIRLKENVKPLSGTLDKVLKLQGVNFTWKSDSLHNQKIGFIAQEMEKVFPELVFTNSVDGYKGINYAEMSAVLTEAVKTQQIQINTQKNEIDSLKLKIQELEQVKKEIEQLKLLINKNK